MQTTTSPPRSSASTPVRALGWLTVATAVGTALLAVGHTGVTVPLVSALGPGGNDPVWPAAIAFTVATLLFALIAVGVFRLRAWSWPLATVTNGLVVAGSVAQYRGVASALGIVLAVASLALLLTPAVRAALLGRAPQTARPDGQGPTG